MRKLSKSTATIVAAVVLLSALGFIGYKYFISNAAIDNYTHRSITAAQANAADDDETQIGSAHESKLDLEPVPVFAGDSEFLGANAKIIYRYHFLKDGHTEVVFEDLPYFLVGLTKMELKEKMIGWELVQFSPRLVVFEKKINARSAERYTIGILDGFITVFYDEEVDGSRVKEQTEIPVDALSAEEISRLTSGIRVIGEEQLIKALEDYAS